MKESNKPIVSRPVFVIGTGRSGTHWLGYSLAEHPQVRATIEQPPTFELSVNMALNASLEPQLLPRIIAAYRQQLAASAPGKLYLEKVHTNIWIAQQLKAAFDNALFLGIERNPYATVASMMRHSGVLAWHRRWREFPIPNRFLGITAEDAGHYESIPVAAQCAMRWYAHHERMKELAGIFAEDLYVINYETFAHRTETVIDKLQRFLGLQEPIPIPEVKAESLNKWREQLSPLQLEQIQSVVEVSPDEASAGKY